MNTELTVYINNNIKEPVKTFTFPGGLKTKGPLKAKIQQSKIMFKGLWIDEKDGSISYYPPQCFCLMKIREVAPIGVFEIDKKPKEK